MNPLQHRHGPLKQREALPHFVPPPPSGEDEDGPPRCPASKGHRCSNVARREVGSGVWVVRFAHLRSLAPPSGHG